MATKIKKIYRYAIFVRKTRHLVSAFYSDKQKCLDFIHKLPTAQYDCLTAVCEKPKSNNVYAKVLRLDPPDAINPFTEGGKIEYI